MFLADMDMKVRRYKTRLEEIGMDVSSSGEDSEEGTIPNESEQPADYLNGFHSSLHFVDEGGVTQREPGTATHLFTPPEDSQSYLSHPVPPSQF